MPGYRMLHTVHDNNLTYTDQTTVVTTSTQQITTEFSAQSDGHAMSRANDMFQLLREDLKRTHGRKAAVCFLSLVRIDQEEKTTEIPVIPPLDDN